MSSHHLVSSIATAAAVGITAFMSTASGPGPAGQPGAGDHTAATARTACAGVSPCRIVARVDVDGDHRADQVGWHQLGDSAAQIRVRTADGALLTHRVDVRLWFGGGAWGGATRIDGEAGAELLVGSNQGAHTPMYTMLTYRSGRLVTERSPAPYGALWQVDAAYGDYMGWQRQLRPGQVAMTQRVAVRVDGTDRFTGDDVTYVWSANRWVRSTQAPTTYASERLAARVGGFHVAGLTAFPGLP